ncbi:MAG: hypothetical protein D6808_01860 [Candidatus Dadabacteria bacterium]|nr:MAG: hypothetical protein D6808_01860 [Candidatus Dadabacteria bacterium]
MDLPEDAKERIESEESVLKETYNSLLRQKKACLSKYRKENARSRELTAQLVGQRRSEEKVQLVSDEAISHKVRDMKGSELSTLEQLIERPYFARIKLKENTNGNIQEYSYKIGYAGNPDSRIIDWRKAPLSKLYYEYQEGEEYCEIIQGREREGTITLRNTIEAERADLRKLSCPIGTFSRTEKGWVVDTLETRQRSGKYLLPNILSLITKEQFQLITEEADTTVIIQGLAGSGKTTVALYRLAWLLHRENSDVSEGSTVVFVRNNALKAYISSALPALEVTSVPIENWREFAIKTVNKAYKAGGVEKNLSPSTTPSHIGFNRIRGSIGLIKAIDFYIADQSSRLVAFLEDSLKWNALPSGVRKLFDAGVQKSLPPIALLKEVLNGIQRGLSSKYLSPELKAELEQAELTLRDALKRLSLYYRDLIVITKNPDKLISEDNGKSLLDDDLIISYHNHLVKNEKNAAISPGDESILLYLAVSKCGGAITPSGESIKYSHIVIDEAQDYTPLEFKTALSMVRNADNLTIVGDRSQNLDLSAPFIGWAKLMDLLGISDENSRFVTLHVPHRSTAQIMALANRIVGREPPKEGRQGRNPVWIRRNSSTEALSDIIDWISRYTEKYPSALTAVICRDKKEAKDAYFMLKNHLGYTVRLCDEDNFTFDTGCVVTDVKSSKGLEFHGVLIWNPSARSYPPNNEARNALYTAITRAEHHLCIVTWERPSPLLPHLSH